MIDRVSKIKNQFRKISLDLVIILTFVLFAGAYHANRVSGASAPLIYSTDAASLASFAAAADHPELFSADEILGDKGIFSFYSTIHLPLIRFFHKFTNDYALASTSLLSLHIFVQLLGFYLLGFVLFKSRFWAVLLAIMNAMPVPLAVSEFWGIYPDILSRISFHAVLPYLLLAAFYWRFKPFAWGWILGATGILMYTHPPSALCWGVSVWLGLWICHPTSWNIYKHIRVMLVSGAAFLLGALPFALNYFNHHAQSSSVNYELIFKIMRYRFPIGSLNVIHAFRQFISNMAFYRILIWGIIGAIFVWFYQRREREKILLVLLWIAGILTTSLLIPFVEQSIARAYKVFPLEIELARNLKYIFPLMFIFSLWPFAAVARISPNKKKMIIVYVVGFLLVFSWSSRQMYKHIIFLKENGYFMLSPDKNKLKTIDMLNAIKRLTPSGSRILPLYSPYALAIRYYALRPLAYSFKDGATFAYANHEKLISWYEKALQVENLMQALRSNDDNFTKIRLTLGLSRKFNAQYVVVSREYFSEDFSPEKLDNLVYCNDLYILLKVSNG